MVRVRGRSLGAVTLQACEQLVGALGLRRLQHEPEREVARVESEHRGQALRVLISGQYVTCLVPR